MSAESQRLERLAKRIRACGFTVEVMPFALRVARGYRPPTVYYLGVNAPRGKAALRKELDGLFDAIHAAGPAARRKAERRSTA